MAKETYEDAVCAYLNVALKDGKLDEFIEALGHVARGHGVAAIAQSTGLGRESLYKALAKDAKPRFETVCKVLQSLGMTLVVAPSTRPSRHG